MTYLVVHTTTDSEELARNLANAAVQQSLAACVQIVPIESIYRWEGKLESAREFRCEMKTRADCVSQLKELIREIHTYDVPEIIEIALHDLSPEYKSWLDSQLQPAAG